jgi:hypothetical protein
MHVRCRDIQPRHAYQASSEMRPLLRYPIAPIRFASEVAVQEFLKGPGPGIHQGSSMITRKDANLPSWYAPTAKFASPAQRRIYRLPNELCAIQTSSTILEDGMARCRREMGRRNGEIDHHAM